MTTAAGLLCVISVYYATDRVWHINTDWALLPADKINIIG